MFLLYFLTVIFLVVVGWMIYYTIQQNPVRNPCPEDPCKKKDDCKPKDPCKPNKCYRCGYPRPQCRCRRQCPSC